MTISQALPVVLFCILTGSYTWGMRGTIIGGERGAMLPGAALALALLHAGGSVPVAEAFPMAISIGAAGMFFGGAQTYGETISMTRDEDVFTRLYARVGLAIKGAGWFGIFGGMFGFGVGAFAGRLELWEIILFVLLLPIVKWLGILLLNTPYRPKDKKFPKFYFSRSRFEHWGGIFLVVLYVLVFAFVKKEWLAVVMTGSGFLFGALGFVIGNLFQNFADTHLSRKWIGGWKWMECVFGGFGGMGVALGWCLFYGGTVRRYAIEITAHSGAWSAFNEKTNTLLAFVWLILLGLYSARYLLRTDRGIGKQLMRLEDVLIWPVFCYVPLFLAFTGNWFFGQMFSSFILVYTLAERVTFGSQKGYKTVGGVHVLQCVLFALASLMLSLQLFTYVRLSAYMLWALYMLVYLLSELYVALDPVHLPARVRESGSVHAALSALGSHRSWLLYACVCVTVLLIWGKSYFTI